MTLNFWSSCLFPLPSAKVTGLHCHSQLSCPRSIPGLATCSTSTLLANCITIFFLPLRRWDSLVKHILPAPEGSTFTFTTKVGKLQLRKFCANQCRELGPITLAASPPGSPSPETLTTSQPTCSSGSLFLCILETAPGSWESCLPFACFSLIDLPHDNLIDLVLRSR